MKFQGLNRKSTPTDDSPGTSHYQENTKLVVSGELRRRNGFSRANIAQLATPIYGIASTVAPVPSICLQGSTGSIDGFNTFGPLWGDVQLLAPTGTATYGYTYSTADGNTYGPITISQLGGTGGAVWSIDGGGVYYINTGGVNGETYRVTVSVDVLLTDTNGSDYYYSVQQGYNDPLGHPGSWTLVGNTITSPGALTLNPSAAGFTMVSAVQPEGTRLTVTSVLTTLGGASIYDVNTAGTTSISAIINTPSAGNKTLAGTYTWSAQKRSGSATTETIVVYRTDNFVESFDIYGKSGSYPIDPSDGTYFTNIPINPGDASCTTSFTGTAGYYYVAVPRRGSMVGPMGLLT